MNKAFHKTIAVLIAISLAGSSLPAQTFTAAPSAIPARGAGPLALSIPSHLGTVTESWSGVPGRTVVLVQDLHGDPGVQRKTKEMLEFFTRRYTVGSIFVEGGSGRIDTSWLSCLSDEKLREGFIEKLVETGRLSGAEYFGATHHYPDNLYGLEDKEMHHANLVRLKQIRDNREIKDLLDGMDRELLRVEDRYLHGRLGRFVRSLRSDEHQSKRYYARLIKVARELNMDLDWYPTLTACAGMERTARRLSVRSVGKELSGLTRELRKRMPYGKYRELLAVTDDFQHIEGLASRWGSLKTTYGLGDRYARLERYLHLCDTRGFNPEELVIDEQLIKRDIIWRLAPGESERRIALLRDYFNSFKRYWQANITPSELRYVKGGERWFMENWIRYTGGESYRQLDPYRGLAETYYRINDERTALFMEKIGAARPCAAPADGKPVTPEELLASSTQIDIAVMGGFHAGDSAAKLREAGISHLVIMPKVENDPSIAEANYRRIMNEQCINVALESGRPVEEQIKIVACYVCEAMLARDASDEEMRRAVGEAIRRLLERHTGEDGDSGAGEISVTGGRGCLVVPGVSEPLVCALEKGTWKASFLDGFRLDGAGPLSTNFGYRIADIAVLAIEAGLLPGTGLADSSARIAESILELFRKGAMKEGTARERYGEVIELINAAEGWEDTGVIISRASGLIHRDAWCLAQLTVINGRRTLYLHESLAWTLKKMDAASREKTIRQLLDHETREFDALYKSGSREYEGLRRFAIEKGLSEAAIGPDLYHIYIKEAISPEDFFSKGQKELFKTGENARSSWMSMRMMAEGEAHVPSEPNVKETRRAALYALLERLREAEGLPLLERLNIVQQSGLITHYSSAQKPGKLNNFIARQIRTKEREVIMSFGKLDYGGIALLVALGRLDAGTAGVLGPLASRFKFLKPEDKAMLIDFARETLDSYRSYHGNRMAAGIRRCLSYDNVRDIAAEYGFSPETVLAVIERNERKERNAGPLLNELTEMKRIADRYKGYLTDEEIDGCAQNPGRFHMNLINAVAEKKKKEIDLLRKYLSNDLKAMPLNERLNLLAESGLSMGELFAGAPNREYLRGKLRDLFFANGFDRDDGKQSREAEELARGLSAARPGKLALLAAFHPELAPFILNVAPAHNGKIYYYGLRGQSGQEFARYIFSAQRSNDGFPGEQSAAAGEFFLAREDIRALALKYRVPVGTVFSILASDPGTLLGSLADASKQHAVERHNAVQRHGDADVDFFISEIEKAPDLYAKLMIIERSPFSTGAGMKKKMGGLKVLLAAVFERHDIARENSEFIAGALCREGNEGILLVLLALGEIDGTTARMLAFQDVSAWNDRGDKTTRQLERIASSLVESYRGPETKYTRGLMQLCLTRGSIDRISEAFGTKRRVVSNAVYGNAGGYLTELDKKSVSRISEELDSRRGGRPGSTFDHEAFEQLLSDVAKAETLSDKLALILGSPLKFGIDRTLTYLRHGKRRELAGLLAAGGLEPSDADQLAGQLLMFQGQSLALLVALGELDEQDALSLARWDLEEIKKRGSLAKNALRIVNSYDSKPQYIREAGLKQCVSYDGVERIMSAYGLNNRTDAWRKALREQPGRWLAALNEISGGAAAFSHNAAEVLRLVFGAEYGLADMSAGLAELFTRAAVEAEEMGVGDRQLSGLTQKVLKLSGDIFPPDTGLSKVLFTGSDDMVSKDAWCLAALVLKDGGAELYIHESLAAEILKMDEEGQNRAIRALLEHEIREHEALRPGTPANLALRAFSGKKDELTPDDYHAFIEEQLKNDDPEFHARQMQLAFTGANAVSAWLSRNATNEKRYGSFTKSALRARKDIKIESFGRLLDLLSRTENRPLSERVDMVIDSGLPIGRVPNVKKRIYSVSLRNALKGSDDIESPKDALRIVNAMLRLECGSLALLVALGELDADTARYLIKKSKKPILPEERWLVERAADMLRSYGARTEETLETGIRHGLSWRGIDKLAELYGLDPEIVLFEMHRNRWTYLRYLRRKSELSRRYRSVVSPEEMKKIFRKKDVREADMERAARSRLSASDYSYMAMIRRIEHAPDTRAKMLILERSGLPLGGGADNSKDGGLQKELAELFMSRNIDPDKARYIAGRLCKKGNRGLVAMLAAAGEIDGSTALLLAYQYRFAWDNRDESTTEILARLAGRLERDYEGAEKEYALQGFRLCLPHSAVKRIAFAMGFEGKDYVVRNAIYNNTGSYLSYMKKESARRRSFRVNAGAGMDSEAFRKFLSRVMEQGSVRERLDMILASGLLFGANHSLVSSQENRKDKILEILDGYGLSELNAEERKAAELLALKIGQLNGGSLAVLAALGDMDWHDALCVALWNLEKIIDKKAFAGRYFAVLRSYDGREGYIRDLGLAHGISWHGLLKAAEAYGLTENRALIYLALKNHPGGWLQMTADISALKQAAVWSMSDINRLARNGPSETLIARAEELARGRRDNFEAEYAFLDEIAALGTLGERIREIARRALPLGADKKPNNPVPCVKKISDILFSSGFRRDNPRDVEAVSRLSERLSLLKQGSLALLVALEMLTPEEAKLIISLRLDFPYEMDEAAKRAFADKIHASVGSVNGMGALVKQTALNQIVGLKELERLADHYGLVNMRGYAGNAEERSSDSDYKHGITLTCDAMKFQPRDYLNRLERVAKLYAAHKDMKDGAGRPVYTFGMLQQALRGNLESDRFQANLADQRKKLRRTSAFSHNAAEVLRLVFGAEYGLADMSAGLAELFTEEPVDESDPRFGDVARSARERAVEILPPHVTLGHVFIGSSGRLIHRGAWCLAALVVDQGGKASLYLHEALAEALADMDPRERLETIEAVLRHEAREYEALYDSSSEEYRRLRQFSGRETGLTPEDYHRFIEQGVSSYGPGYTREQRDLMDKGRLAANARLEKGRGARGDDEAPVRDFYGVLNLVDAVDGDDDEAIERRIRILMGSGLPMGNNRGRVNVDEAKMGIIVKEAIDDGGRDLQLTEKAARRVTESLLRMRPGSIVMLYIMGRISRQAAVSIHDEGIDGVAGLAPVELKDLIRTVCSYGEGASSEVAYRFILSDENVGQLARIFHCDKEKVFKAMWMSSSNYLDHIDRLPEADRSANSAAVAARDAANPLKVTEKILKTVLPSRGPLTVAVIPEFDAVDQAKLLNDLLKKARENIPVIAITPKRGRISGKFLCSVPCEAGGKYPVAVKLYKSNWWSVPVIYAHMNGSVPENEQRKIFAQVSDEFLRRMQTDPVLRGNLGDLGVSLDDYDGVQPTGRLAAMDGKGPDDILRLSSLNSVRRPDPQAAAVCELSAIGPDNIAGQIWLLTRLKEHGISTVLFRGSLRAKKEEMKQKRGFINGALKTRRLLRRSHQAGFKALYEVVLGEAKQGVLEAVVGETESYLRAGYDGISFDARLYPDIPDWWFDEIAAVFKRMKISYAPFIVLDERNAGLAAKAGSHGFMVTRHVVPGEQMPRAEKDECLFLIGGEGDAPDPEQVAVLVKKVFDARPGFILIAGTYLIRDRADEWKYAKLFVDLRETMISLLAGRAEDLSTRDFYGISYEGGIAMGKDTCPAEFAAAERAGEDIMALAGRYRELQADRDSAAAWLKDSPEAEALFPAMRKALLNNPGFSAESWKGWETFRSLEESYEIYREQNNPGKKAAALLTALEIMYGLCAMRLETRYQKAGRGLFDFDANTMATMDDMLFAASGGAGAMEPDTMPEAAMKYLESRGISFVSSCLENGEMPDETLQSARQAFTGAEGEFMFIESIARALYHAGRGRKGESSMPELRSRVMTAMERAAGSMPVSSGEGASALRDWAMARAARDHKLFLDPLTSWEEISDLRAVFEPLGVESLLKAS